MKIAYDLKLPGGRIVIDIYDTVLENMLSDSYDFSIKGRKSLQDIKDTMDPVLALYLIRQTDQYSSDVLEGGRLDILLRTNPDMLELCRQLTYKGQNLYQHAFTLLKVSRTDDYLHIARFDTLNDVMRLIK